MQYVRNTVTGHLFPDSPDLIKFASKKGTNLEIIDVDETPIEQSSTDEPIQGSIVSETDAPLDGSEVDSGESALPPDEIPGEQPALIDGIEDNFPDLPGKHQKKQGGK